MKNTHAVIRANWIFLAIISMVIASASTLKSDTGVDKVDTSPRMRIEPSYRDDKVIQDKSQEIATEVFLFREKEFNIDAFGLYAVESQEGAYEDGFGGGLGLSYFINRFVGFGLEGYWWNGDDLISSVSGNIILRYPIEEWRLAPYMIAGVGGNFDADQGEDQVNGSGGLGLEYRFDAQWSLFTDGRYVATEKNNDYALARSGIRFSF